MKSTRRRTCASPQAFHHRPFERKVALCRVESRTAHLGTLLAASLRSGESRCPTSRRCDCLSWCVPLSPPFASLLTLLRTGFVPTTGLTRDVPLLGRLLMRYILSLMPFAVSESEGAARLARTIPASPSDSDDALSSLLAELSKADNPPLIFLAGPSTASVPTVEEVRSGAKGAVKGGVAEDLLARTEDDEMWKQVGWLLPSEDTMRSWSAST